MGSKARLPFEDLLRLQDILDYQLVEGRLELSTYNVEFNELLRAAGYSMVDYEREVDRRWDYIQTLRRRSLPFGCN